MFLQLIWCYNDSKFAPHYACLSADFLEETILFPKPLLFHFTLSICKLIEEIFKCFMDKGFGLWQNNANIGVFCYFL